MLTQANQVLGTCSQLFTAKQDHSGLAHALSDTSATIERFLAKA